MRPCSFNLILRIVVISLKFEAIIISSDFTLYSSPIGDFESCLIHLHSKLKVKIAAIVCIKEPIFSIGTYRLFDRTPADKSRKTISNNSFSLRSKFRLVNDDGIFDKGMLCSVIPRYDLKGNSHSTLYPLARKIIHSRIVVISSRGGRG